MNYKYMKIFNLNQANYLFQQGCVIEKIGYFYENGNPYVKFVSDELLSKKMEEWKNRKK